MDMASLSLLLHSRINNDVVAGAQSSATHFWCHSIGGSPNTTKHFWLASHQPAENLLLHMAKMSIFVVGPLSSTRQRSKPTNEALMQRAYSLHLDPS